MPSNEWCFAWEETPMHHPNVAASRSVHPATGVTLVETLIVLAVSALVAVGAVRFHGFWLDLIAESDVRERVPRLLDLGEESLYLTYLATSRTTSEYRRLAAEDPRPALCPQQKHQRFVVGPGIARNLVEEVVVPARLASDHRNALLESPFGEGNRVGPNFVLSSYKPAESSDWDCRPGAESRLLFLCLAVKHGERERLGKALGALIPPDPSTACPLPGTENPLRRGSEGGWLVWVRHLPAHPLPLLEYPG